MVKALLSNRESYNISWALINTRADVRLHDYLVALDIACSAVFLYYVRLFGQQPVIWDVRTCFAQQ